MKRLLTHLASVTSAWRRVLQLIWQTQPWFITGLIVLTILSGLVPSAQIQLITRKDGPGTCGTIRLRLSLYT